MIQKRSRRWIVVWVFLSLVISAYVCAIPQSGEESGEAVSPQVVRTAIVQTVVAEAAAIPAAATPAPGPQGSPPEFEAYHDEIDSIYLDYRQTVIDWVALMPLAGLDDSEYVQALNDKADRFTSFESRVEALGAPSELEAFHASFLENLGDCSSGAALLEDMIEQFDGMDEATLAAQGNPHIALLVPEFTQMMFDCGNNYLATLGRLQNYIAQLDGRSDPYFAAGERRIAIGETTTVGLVEGGVHTWTFEGSEGQHVGIAFVDVTEEFLLWTTVPTIETSTVLGVGGGSQEDNTVVWSLTLPATGVYQVSVKNLSASGAYSVSVQGQ